MLSCLWNLDFDCLSILFWNRVHVLGLLRSDLCPCSPVVLVANTDQVKVVVKEDHEVPHESSSQSDLVEPIGYRRDLNLAAILGLKQETFRLNRELGLFHSELEAAKFALDQVARLIRNKELLITNFVELERWLIFEHLLFKLVEV